MDGIGLDASHGKGVAGAACAQAKANLCNVLDDKYAKYTAEFNVHKKGLETAANKMYTESMYLKGDGCSAPQYPVIGGYTWHKP